MTTRIQIHGRCPRCKKTLHLVLRKDQLERMLEVVEIEDEKDREKALRQILSSLDIKRGAPN